MEVVELIANYKKTWIDYTQFLKKINATEVQKENQCIKHENK